MHAQLATMFLPLATAVKTPSALLVGLLVALFLASVLGAIGKRLFERDHLDDLIRTVIAVVGVSGLLVFIPIFAIVGEVVQKLYVQLANLLGLSDTGFGFTLIAVIMGFIGIGLYYRKGTFGNLFWMTILLSPLFKTEFMTQVVNGYLNNLAVPIWNGLVSLFNTLAGMHL